MARDDFAEIMRTKEGREIWASAQCVIVRPIAPPAPLADAVLIEEIRRGASHADKWVVAELLRRMVDAA